MPKQYKGPYNSSTVPSTTPHLYEGQYPSSTMHINLGKSSIMVQHTAQLMTSFRTTTPSAAMTGRMTTKQVNPVQAHPETSCKALLEHIMKLIIKGNKEKAITISKILNLIYKHTRGRDIFDKL